MSDDELHIWGPIHTETNMTGRIEMEAGRDIDVLVAEKVMGWRSLGDLWVTVDEKIMGKEWSPSTDIAAAWAVLEKFTTNYSTSREPFGYGIKIEHRTEGVGEKWFVTGVWTACCPEYENMDEEKFTVEAETAPLAICLAALKAVGVNV